MFGLLQHSRADGQNKFHDRWVVVKSMVPFWIITIRHLVLRGPKRDHNFDDHPDDMSPTRAEFVAGLWMHKTSC